MKPNLVLIFLKLVVFLSIAAACNPEVKSDDEAKISTDVIDVPASASGTPVQLGSEPALKVYEEKHDFGNVTQGEKVSFSFLFKNIGGSDLVISSAHGSCGCTVPTYPKQAIKPGKEDKIDVIFDSEGKSGIVEKTITLLTNCNPSNKILTISASIIVPEQK